MMFWALARVSFRAAKIVSCNNKKYFMVYDQNYHNCSTLYARAFRTSESADFSEDHWLGLWNHFGLGLSEFSCLRIYTVKKSTFHKKNPKILIFSFCLKSYYSLYKPHAQISTIVNNECPRKSDTSLRSKSQIWTKFFSQPPVTLKTPQPKKKKFAQQNFARARPQIL
jgi:hypothetical protein